MLGGKKGANVGANVGEYENDEVSINIFFFSLFFFSFSSLKFSMTFKLIKIILHWFFSLFSRHLLVTKHRTIIKCNFKVKEVCEREKIHGN